MTLELRFVPEIRVAETGRTLYGVACPFDRPANIRSSGGAFVEVVAPGAFARCLSSKVDVSANKDHDGGSLLGRTRSGSLKLTETAAGLEYSLELPKSATGDELAYFASRGELAGCSIGFKIPDGGEKWKDGTRTLNAIDLHHVAIVTGFDPAYGGTSANLRHQGRILDAETIRRRRWLDTL